MKNIVVIVMVLVLGFAGVMWYQGVTPRTSASGEVAIESTLIPTMLVPTVRSVPVVFQAATPVPLSTATPFPRMGDPVGAVVLDLFPVYANEDGATTQSFAVVSNTSDAWLDTTGWTMAKAGGGSAFQLPAQLLGPGASVVIWSIEGEANDAYTLFWSAQGATWNEGDKGEVRGARGVVYATATAVVPEDDHDHHHGE